MSNLQHVFVNYQNIKKNIKRGTEFSAGLDIIEKDKPITFLKIKKNDFNVLIVPRSSLFVKGLRLKIEKEEYEKYINYKIIENYVSEVKQPIINHERKKQIIFYKSSETILNISDNTKNIIENTIIKPGTNKIDIDFKLPIDFPNNNFVYIHPKDPIGPSEEKIEICGIIDSDYKDPIYLVVYNKTQEEIKIKYDDIKIEVLEYQKFKNETETTLKIRHGGFGSTNLKY